MQKRIFLESNTANLEEILDLPNVQSYRTLSVRFLVSPCLGLGPAQDLWWYLYTWVWPPLDPGCPLPFGLLPGVGSGGFGCVAFFWLYLSSFSFQYLRSVHIVQDFPVPLILCCQLHGWCSTTRMLSNFTRFWSECVGIDQRFLGWIFCWKNHASNRSMQWSSLQKITLWGCYTRECHGLPCCVIQSLVPDQNEYSWVVWLHYDDSSFNEVYVSCGLKPR